MLLLLLQLPLLLFKAVDDAEAISRFVGFVYDDDNDDDEDGGKDQNDDGVVVVVVYSIFSTPVLQLLILIGFFVSEFDAAVNLVGSKS